MHGGRPLPAAHCLTPALGWCFLTHLKANRSVNPDRTGQMAVSDVELGPGRRVAQLKGFGLIRLFRTVSPDGHVEYWATSRLEMSGAERAQVRSAIGQGNHLLMSVRAYLRWEVHRIRTGVSHFEAKASIIREAVRTFLGEPTFSRLATA